jgi:hypothetical protein
MPVDAQVSIGMLLAASDYHEHIDVLHKDAQTILADKVLADLARKISKAKDVHELAILTADVWRRFQDLGVLLKDKCVPPPPEEDEDLDDEGRDDEDTGEQPDLGSLGNEGQPSPSDGDGEGGSSSDDDNKKEDDGADSSGDQRQSDPTASSGSGSSSTQGSGSGEDQRESGMSNVPEQSDDKESSGGGDRVQDERDSGSEDDLSSGGSPGSDDDGDGRDADGHDADGGDSSESESDVGEGDAGKELTDGEGAEGSGQESEGGGDEGNSDKPADAESEGGTTDDSAEEQPGERTGTGDGSDGGAGGGAGSAEADEARDGGPDEGDEPANFSSATLEELVAAIQAGSLHEMFDDESTDNFASGQSVLNKHPDPIEAEMWAAALLVAALRSHWFEGPSEEVGGVHIIEYGENKGIAGFNAANVNKTDLTPPHSIVGPVVNKGRITFSPNKRTRNQTGLKSGKVNPRALSRIPSGADDLFRKRHVAAKRSYHVIITMDVSGSTASEAPSEHFPDQTTLEMMQRSVFAQAEALAKLNISFEVWAHTADWFLAAEERTEHFTKKGGWDELPPMDVWLLQVKTPGDKWNDDARQRMHALQPLGGNLDGHTLQIMRKRADEMRRKFTDVIICYYTDGAMPASNAQEEGRILKDETALCKRKGYPLLAVAAGTDSPKAWGFDTVRIDSDKDLPKVMEQLERVIL